MILEETGDKFQETGDPSSPRLLRAGKFQETMTCWSSGFGVLEWGIGVRKCRSMGVREKNGKRKTIKSTYAGADPCVRRKDYFVSLCFFLFYKVFYLSGKFCFAFQISRCNIRSKLWCNKNL